MGELSGLGNTPGKTSGRNVGIAMQDYKFVRVAVMICVFLPPWLYSKHGWSGGVLDLLQLSYQDLEMATGILLNHLDIAAVNALVIWLCKDPTWNTRKSRLFFARIRFAPI